ncbi:MAG: hypothetical protein K2P68_11145 [Sphingomonas sp.]|nr:hypothetical protein [Sphingomonas sp.]
MILINSVSTYRFWIVSAAPVGCARFGGSRRPWPLRPGRSIGGSCLAGRPRKRAFAGTRMVRRVDTCLGALWRRCVAIGARTARI